MGRKLLEMFKGKQVDRAIGSAERTLQNLLSGSPVQGSVVAVISLGFHFNAVHRNPSQISQLSNRYNCNRPSRVRLGENNTRYR